MRRPQPKTVKVDCDVCGQDWTKHKADAKGVVQLDECVRLLKVALAAKPGVVWNSAGSGVTHATPFFNFTGGPGTL